MNSVPAPATYPASPASTLSDRAAADGHGDLGPAPVGPAPSAAPRRMLATAVYVAGSTDLQSGHRYGIAITESRLQILGPMELNPERVALEHPLAALEARPADGRLILADRNGLVLAFMAVAGPPTHDLAVMIMRATGRWVEP